MTGTCIRTATPEDGVALRSLLAELGYTVSKEKMSVNLSTLLNDQSCGIYVVGDPPSVHGVILVYQSKSLTEGCYAVIGNLVVTTGKRGQGLGKLLVRKAIEWTKQQDLATLRVGSQTYRDEAHQFYTGLGFTQYKTQHWFEYRL